MQDDLPTLTTGQKIKTFRVRSGKSRAVLGGLVGRSAEWVKSVEMGRILPPRLPVLNQIARALNVPVQALMVEDEQAVTVPTQGHAALPAVRTALNLWPVPVPDQPQPLEHIAARLALAWRARHAAPDHRTVIGGLLPDLIRDAQSATLVYRGEQQRQAKSLLADVLGLSQMFLAYQPAGDLLWRVVDRAMLAGQESDNPVALAQAVWFAVEAHRDSGDWDTAMDINLGGLTLLEQNLDGGSIEALGMYGALHASAAFTAARAGESGRAWRYWDEADAVMRRLPDDYYQRVTSFSRPVMIAHAVTLEVELRKGGKALQMATGTQAENIQSRPRRARHLIEVARGHHLKREYEPTLTVLARAYETAPETIRYNLYARQIVSELVNGPVTLRRDANELATKVGLLG